MAALQGRCVEGNNAHTADAAVARAHDGNAAAQCVSQMSLMAARGQHGTHCPSGTSWSRSSLTRYCCISSILFPAYAT